VRELGIPQMLKEATRVQQTFQELTSRPGVQELFENNVVTPEAIEVKSEVNEIISQFLDIIEGIIDIAYGERLSDDRFRKTPEALQAFKETAAFEAFLLSFANEPDVAKNFIEGLVPGGVAAGVAAPTQPVRPQDHLPSARERFTAVQQEKVAETEEAMRARIRAELEAEARVTRPDGLN
jgi:hypothetical protein